MLPKPELIAPEARVPTDVKLEATTAEPTTVTQTYEKIKQQIATVSTPVDTNNKRFFAI